MTHEFNFDGLVGLTHNYGGLSAGNVASTKNEGRTSNPRAAALQGIAKMRFVSGLGIGQGVLPPPARPCLRALRCLGLSGSDEHVLARAATHHEHLLRLCSSSSAMWAANAATVAPSADTADGRVHFVPANLQTMFHRAIEADTTTRTLRLIFADAAHFCVHEPLPATSHFADEGAANHTRLITKGKAAVHLIAWGRRAFDPIISQGPRRFLARQTYEASAALGRALSLDATRVLLPQQDPAGIDAGAFHTDVLAVGHDDFLMLHEQAFVDADGLCARLNVLLGAELHVLLAREAELPVADAVAAYPFNSQLLTLPSGAMVIVAPEDSRDNAPARRFLERVIAESNPVEAVHYLDVRESMDNGGGPACLRLRVALSDLEVHALTGRVLLDDALACDLEAWATKHYRDRLIAQDLGDVSLWREVMTALDELSQLLNLPGLYAFQQ